MWRCLIIPAVAMAAMISLEGCDTVYLHSDTMQQATISASATFAKVDLTQTFTAEAAKNDVDSETELSDATDLVMVARESWMLAILKDGKQLPGYVGNRMYDLIASDKNDPPIALVARLGTDLKQYERDIAEQQLRLGTEQAAYTSDNQGKAPPSCSDLDGRATSGPVLSEAEGAIYQVCQQIDAKTKQIAEAKSNITAGKMQGRLAGVVAMLESKIALRDQQASDAAKVTKSLGDIQKQLANGPDKSASDKLVAILAQASKDVEPAVQLAAHNFLAMQIQAVLDMVNAQATGVQPVPSQGESPPAACASSTSIPAESRTAAASAPVTAPATSTPPAAVPATGTGGATNSKTPIASSGGTTQAATVASAILAAIAGASDLSDVERNALFSPNSLRTALAYECHQAALIKLDLTALDQEIAILRDEEDAIFTELVFLSEAEKNWPADVAQGKVVPASAPAADKVKWPLLLLSSSFTMGQLPFERDRYRIVALHRTLARNKVQNSAQEWLDLMKPGVDELTASGQGGIQVQTVASMALAAILVGRSF